MSVRSLYGLFWPPIVLMLLCFSPLLALPVEDLDPNQEWRIKDLMILNNEKVRTSELADSLSTKTRPWYALWRSRPVFDPAVFASDLERIVRLYQDKGYYETKVSHDLDINTEEGLVTAKIEIDEGEPIRVRQLSIDIVDAPELRAELDALVPKLPLREGNIFAVDAYQQSEAQ